MSYDLVEEVLDHAPPMTPAERLLLVALAEQMRSRRVWWVETDTLARRTCLSEEGIRKALKRLADRGLDVRVKLGEDKRGRPYYTRPGKAPRYELPRFEVPPGCECEKCRKAPEAAAGAPPIEPGTPVPGTRTPVPGMTASTSPGHGRDEVVPGTSVPGTRTVVPGTRTTGRAAGPVVPPKPSGPKPEGDASPRLRAGALGDPRSLQDQNQAWTQQSTVTAVLVRRFEVLACNVPLAEIAADCLTTNQGANALAVAETCDLDDVDGWLALAADVGLLDRQAFAGWSDWLAQQPRQDQGAVT